MGVRQGPVPYWHDQFLIKLEEYEFYQFEERRLHKITSSLELPGKMADTRETTEQGVTAAS